MIGMFLAHSIYIGITSTKSNFIQNKLAFEYENSKIKNKKILGNVLSK